MANKGHSLTKSLLGPDIKFEDEVIEVAQDSGNLIRRAAVQNKPGGMVHRGTITIHYYSPAIDSNSFMVATQLTGADAEKGFDISYAHCMSGVAMATISVNKQYGVAHKTTDQNDSRSEL